MARKQNDKVPDPLHGGAVHVPRSRGAVSGILLAVLGAWGALIPFIGPLFSFGYTPNASWHWTAARGWLEALPGAVVVIGALLLLLSTNRITASFGGWLAVAGGTWFVIGTNFAELLHLGAVGTPRGSSKGLRLLETLTFFDGLGALILFLAAGAVGRLSVRSVRDVRAAQRREVEAEAEQRRQEAYAETRRQQLAETRRQQVSDRDGDVPNHARPRMEATANDRARTDRTGINPDDGATQTSAPSPDGAAVNETNRPQIDPTQINEAPAEPGAGATASDKRSR